MKTRPRRVTLLSIRTGRPLPPVDTMTAQALHEELVEDACAGVAGGEKYLRRQIAAYIRIAALRGCPVEQAHTDVVAAVNTRGHNMPLI